MKQPCRHFLRGYCPMQGNCTYEHGVNDTAAALLKGPVKGNPFGTSSVAWGSSTFSAPAPAPSAGATPFGSSAGNTFATPPQNQAKPIFGNSAFGSSSGVDNAKPLPSVFGAVPSSFGQGGFGSANPFSNTFSAGFGSSSGGGLGSLQSGGLGSQANGGFGTQSTGFGTQQSNIGFGTQQSNTGFGLQQNHGSQAGSVGSGTQQSGGIFGSSGGAFAQQQKPLFSGSTNELSSQTPTLTVAKSSNESDAAMESNVSENAVLSANASAEGSSNVAESSQDAAASKPVLPFASKPANPLNTEIPTDTLAETESPVAETPIPVASKPAVPFASKPATPFASKPAIPFASKPAIPAAAKPVKATGSTTLMESLTEAVNEWKGLQEKSVSKDAVEVINVKPAVARTLTELARSKAIIEETSTEAFCRGAHLMPRFEMGRIPELL
eukprot:Blabericola_migrator_1__6214@NODE_3137_length_2012_cov_92_573779_g1963_i0_p1_GENE_NODE_3137_length_2012_cov_92_573779_g1963_i0NODE_3137_length_2012_cov_92_573779_g1963_i0_p1_ORF_typecomplete_len439_score78_19zfCCCH/PF00642_24/0_0062zfCCCH_4/PF18044_1/0_013Torus/PF16131_5/0_023Torus/PF16131_5/1_2e04zf_CCCH_4/PF18345_1/0_19zf_CCCH_4/PF18345_1/1_7e02zfCCCH_3/PF15663_5/0_18_NODE_3137_length_2012_cov_92_573779_g1963_i03181634